MKKSKVYTKTGDQGQTGLVSGNRILKSDERIDLYGELDELNSRIGVSLSLLAGPEYESIGQFLRSLQSAIFDLGSNMACEAEFRAKYNLPQITEKLIQEIEDEIDRMDSELTPLKSFVLPGGSYPAATIHLCRTNARSVERKLIAYSTSSKEELPVNSLIFLNRLSDYFFVLSRYVNKSKNTEEILWQPRK